MVPQRRMYVVLDGADFERLQRQAQAERRDVRDQAAVVIAKALQQQDGQRAAASASAAPTMERAG
jgi:hypothetical protein